MREQLKTITKLKQTKELEINSARAGWLLNSFVNNLKWEETVNFINRISKISCSKNPYRPTQI